MGEAMATECAEGDGHQNMMRTVGMIDGPLAGLAGGWMRSWADEIVDGGLHQSAASL
jgi:hypothetical protein